MAKKTTTTKSSDGAVTTRRRGPATHSQIRITIDLPLSPLQPQSPLPRRISPSGAPIPAAKTLLDAVMLLTPLQREGLANASQGGRGWRLVVAFLPSESRDVDEAIRALPAALQPFVTSAEKL